MAHQLADGQQQGEHARVAAVIYRDSSFVTLHQLPDFIESDE
ncbi:MAG: hypothetical protein ACLT74_12600 [Christensenellales bacterium]